MTRQPVLNSVPVSIDLKVDAAETANYNAASKTVQINVKKGDQTITWDTPADITNGTLLGDDQLDATVAGTGTSPTGALTYDPAAGIELGAGLH